MITENNLMEQSFGIVPIMYKNSEPYVFIIQNYSLAWLLPKGHAQEGELPKDTAARELLEETQLGIVKYLDIGPFTENYTYCRMDKQIDKQVTYFPAIVKGRVRLQKEEIRDGRWIPLSQLPSNVSFPELRTIAQEVCTLFTHASE